MVDESAQAEAARFQHLLEPIRDLAQNWSIDIAAELEEYLGELESITISFEDGRSLDFAEAALVIQGSACIYSKKVEHLYTLVYQTLNQVVEKKRVAKEAASVDAEGNDADVAELVHEDTFLTLDDSLKEVDNIVLPVGAPLKDASAFTLTRTPLTLLPGADDKDATGCKMHSCEMHSSGALLLPYMSLPMHMLAVLPSYALPLGGETGATEHGGYAPDGGAHFGDDDDDDSGMPDVRPDDDEWKDALPPSSEEADEGGAVDGEESAPPSTPPGAREAAAAEESRWDPWAPLNPHDTGTSTARPFRKGRT